MRKKLTELTEEKKQLDIAKKQQEQILAKQLRAAYSTGHHDYLKLILNPPIGLLLPIKLSQIILY